MNTYEHCANITATITTNSVDCTLSPQNQQPTAFITLLKRLDGKPAGKTFTATSGEVHKIVSGHSGRYLARTITYTGTPAEIAQQHGELLAGLTTAQCIILGHIPAMGDAEYLILPKNDLKSRGLDPTGTHVIDGKPVLARLKHHFAPSRLLLLDFDPDPAMPDDLLALDEPGRWALLCSVFPEFSGAARVVMPSSSTRARMPDGSPIGGGKAHGEHTTIVLDRAPTAAELDDMRNAAQIRLWAAGYGFIKPSKAGAELRRTLIDTSVWAGGREVFSGPPDVRDGLILAPAEITVHDGGGAALLAEATAEQITDFSKATGCTVIKHDPADEGEQGGSAAQGNLVGIRARRQPRLAFENASALRMHTRIETEKGTMTVAEFLASKHQRLRCQATFRDSSSWAGILSKTPNGCKLYDVGTSTRYVLATEALEIAGDLIEALDALSKADDANAQGHARAVYMRHKWRAPFRTSYRALHKAICDSHPAIDADDLTALIEHDRQRTRTAAIKAVQLDSSALPMGATYRAAASPAEIAAAIQQQGGIHLVKAPHGAGKTQGILKPIAQAADLRGTVAIAPRKSLVADLAHKDRLNLADYLQSGAGETHLAICLNSIANPKYADAMLQAKVLLIDEIGRCVAEVHNPHGTLKGTKGRDVWQALGAAMSGAEIAVGVDADLSTRDVWWLAELTRQPITVWVIAEAERDLKGTFTSDSEALAQLDEALAQGGHVLGVMDTANQVAGQAARLRAVWPDKKIVAIHQKPGCATAGTDEAVALLADINAGVADIDVLLLSPAVESGVSLNVAHFTKHIAIYTGTVLPSQFNQALLRDRTATTWTIGISGHGFKSDTTSAGAILNGLGAASRRITELSDGSITAVPATDFDRHCVAATVAANATRNCYANHLWYLLEHRGWTVERGQTGNNATGRALHREAKRQLADEQRVAITEAADIDAKTAAQHREAHRLTQAESAELARFDVRQATGITDGELPSIAVDVWRDGRLEREVQRLEDALIAPAPSERDQSESELGVPLAARHHDGARRESIQALFSALGIDADTGDGTITAESALAAWHALKASPHAAILESCGITRFSKAPSSPVRWASDTLAKFGLWIQGTGQKGMKYTLAMDAKITRDGEIKLPGFSAMREFIDSRGRVARSRACKELIGAASSSGRADGPPTYRQAA
ncbi:MAG: hypothetical protein VBE63_23920 [Lamprobacter sp.]|uniref:hypothetical protein n=1 Tax=Lamprobacter sp. TaxID=3100796 RepID=UPI002B2616A5|nr:hypothetical protein [Lamprobacter sp.]MEA3642963.1 hypothetical protein [Lamprobacter sp.]